MRTLIQRDYLGPDELGIGSEAMSISWDFITRDPTFENFDREKLRADLARLVFGMLETGECNMLQIANRAIRKLRDKYEYVGYPVAGVTFPRPVQVRLRQRASGHQ